MIEAKYILLRNIIREERVKRKKKKQEFIVYLLHMFPTMPSDILIHIAKYVPLALSQTGRKQVLDVLYYRTPKIAKGT